jgi:hypothetical protein
MFSFPLIYRCGRSFGIIIDHQDLANRSRDLAEAEAAQSLE